MTRIEELEQSIDEAVEKFRLEINKHKAEIEKLKKEVALAELKESKEEGKWKPKSAEEYWFRNTDKGEIESVHRYEGDGWDDWRVNNIPIFKTEEDCRRYWHFMDTVKEKSYEFSKEEWEDWDIYKYYVSYESDKKVFRILSNQNYKYLGQIYFRTVEDAQYIIDNFKDELMEYFV